MKKDTDFAWNQEAQGAFDTLKACITDEPVLAHPNLTKQFKLEVDASGYVVGVVLMQWQSDGKRHPVGFYSVTFNLVEHNYNIYDLELLAIVKAL